MKLLHIVMAVVVGASALMLVACSSEPAPSPSPSASPPLSDLQALAERYRSGDWAPAWWVSVDPAHASMLLDKPASTFEGDTFLLILYGDYKGGDGEPCPWGYIAADAKGSGDMWVTDARPDTGGREWTPLALSSPGP
jgi:hypothetical protein